MCVTPMMPRVPAGGLPESALQGQASCSRFGEVKKGLPLDQEATTHSHRAGWQRNRWRVL